MNKIGPTVHYGDDLLILRLKTAIPSHLHKQLLTGLVTAQKLALLAEDLTQDERAGILGLNEILKLLMPTEAILEHVMTLPSYVALRETA